MTNIKPSQLPEGSVIGNYNDGLWFKDVDKWEAIAPKGAALHVSDSGFPNMNDVRYIRLPADNYFEDYDIISLPVGWDIHRGSLVKRQDV